METTLEQTTSVKPNRRRWVLAALIGGLFVAGWWFWSQQLNTAEQQLVGEWLTINHYEGSTCARNWTFRKDRTCRIFNIHRYAATPTRGAFREVRITNATWSYKHGQLIVDPERAATHRLNLLGAKGYWAIRNRLQGTNNQVFDGELLIGRLNLTSDQSFTITWWDPATKSDTSTQEWTRRHSAEFVEPPAPE